ncbi:hypothetical protein [Sphingobium aquiterrae]|uniref:hypothetical protein n=1 Tax=Sphingobium aquiterrae TaxID=2038656 RepID=UPI00301B2B6F
MTLLAEIDAFLRETGMSSTEFGKAAVNDYSFVRAYRSEKIRVGNHRAARVRAFMEGKGFNARPGSGEAPMAIRRPDRLREGRPTVDQVGPAPFLPIRTLHADHGPIANAIEVEARRLHVPLSTFLSELVSKGWAAHVSIQENSL